MPQTLSETERLILSNQYEILAHLTKQQSYSRLAANLRDGHRWIYEQPLQLSKDLPHQAADHVLTILEIYSALHSSYRVLTDKAGIDEHQLNFPGFDGNNESELLHFAQALSENGNYSDTIGKTALNSHQPTTAAYTRMIKEWRNLGEPDYPYSSDQITRILAARRDGDRAR